MPKNCDSPRPDYTYSSYRYQNLRSKLVFAKLDLAKVKRDLRRCFDPITFTFSENSNYSQKSLLKSKVIRQNLQVDVNKLFAFKSLLTIPGNVLPFHLKETFTPII